MYLVWITKYRKRLLSVGMALSAGGMIRQISAELAGNYSRDDRSRPCSRPFELSADARSKPNHAMAEGDEFATTAAGVQLSTVKALAKGSECDSESPPIAVLGRAQNVD